jgi:TonB family protein
MSGRSLCLLLATLALASPVAVHAAEESGSKEAKEAASRAGNSVISTGDKGATIDANELSKPPKLTKPAKVTYPPEAIGKSQGDVEVTLLVDLDEKGEVTGASVVEPKTPTGLGFEEAAQTAAYSLVFEPAELMGKPTAVQIVYKFKFVPPKPPAPAPVANPDSGVTEAGAPVEAPKPAPVENFEGVLLERGTRLPMSGVLVTVYRKDGEQPVGFESITDAKGQFHFFDLEPGTWKVFAEPPSYYPFRTTEEIHPSEKVSAKYYVEKGSYNPFDKVVTAQRERKEVSRTVIESVVIDKMPGAMGDPLAVIQNFAGVNRAQAGTGLVMVRGSSPKDTQIYVDGVTVPIIYHFFGLRSVLPVAMIENLEFYPGNFSSYYGRASGGAIDVTVKKLKPPKFGGQFDINLLDSSLYLETPIGEKASVAASVRRSYIDYVIKAVMPSDAPVTDLTLPRYYDYQLLANYRPAPAHDLRFFFFGSDDKFKVLFKRSISETNEVQGNEFSMATNFYRGLFTYKFIPSDRFENTLRLSQGRDNGDFRFFQFFSHFTMDTTHLRDTVRYEWSKKLALTAGMDAIYYRVSFHVYSPKAPAEGQEESEFDLGDTAETNVNGMNIFQPGAFLELEWRPVKGLLILPSVRYDYFSDINRSAAGPRLTVRYQLSKPWAFKGGIGLFYQPPALTEGETDKSFGNPNLKPQQAIHYSAGVEWKPRDHLNFDVTGFYKDLRRWVSNTDALKSDGKTPLNYDNNGAGRVYGMELVAKHDLSKNFTGWFAYTLSRAERRDSGQTSYRLFQYDQTHILTVFGTYALPRNWQIGSRFRLVSGNPSTPVVGTVLNASTGGYQPIYGARYSSRMNPFIQFDIRIDKRWVFDSWMLNAYLDLQNVFNRKNPEGLNYNYDYTKSSVTSGFPIYPILGLRGEF